MKEKTKGHFKRNFIISFLRHLLTYAIAGVIAILFIVFVIGVVWLAAQNLTVTILSGVIVGVIYVTAVNAYHDAKSREE